MLRPAWIARRTWQVVRRRLREVRDPDVDPEALERVEDEALVPLEPLGRLGGDVLDRVELALLEPGDARPALGDDLERDRIEVGDLAAAEAGPVGERLVDLVLLEALEPDVGVRDPLDELVGARADVGVALAARLRRLLRRHDDDRHPERRQLFEERRHRLLQLDLERVLLRRGQRRHRVEDLLVHPEPLVALERRQHVGRGHLLPVVEEHALPQRERVREAVGADDPLLGQLRDGGVRLVAGEQGLVHVHRDVAARDRGGEVHVEPGDLRLLGEHHVAPAPGRRVGREDAEQGRETQGDEHGTTRDVRTFPDLLLGFGRWRAPDVGGRALPSLGSARRYPTRRRRPRGAGP